MTTRDNADTIRVLKIVESNFGLPREGFDMHQAKSPRWRVNDKTKWKGNQPFLPYKKLKLETQRVSRDSKIPPEPFNAGYFVKLSPPKQVDSRLLKCTKSSS
jgi:hypothetical protein